MPIQRAKPKFTDIKNVSISTSQMPAGTTLQTQSVLMADALSLSSASTNDFQNVTGLAVSITPSATSSKILVKVNSCFHHSAASTIHLSLLRTISGGASTKLGLANVSNRVGSNMATLPDDDIYAVGIYPATFNFVDSPSTTSACTYQLQITAGSSYNVNLFVNRTSNDTDADYGARTSSTIIAQEIKG